MSERALDHSSEVVITVPLPILDGGADTERLELDVWAVVDKLGSEAILDGTGRGPDRFDIFLETSSPDLVLEHILQLEFPPGTVAEVTTTESSQNRRTVYSVPLAGRRQGTRSRATTTVIKARVGDWTAVPVDGGGYVIGRITHLSRVSMIVYFFGPIRDTIPPVRELTDLTADQAVIALRCDRPDFEPGEPWQLIGTTPFDAAGWPLPELEFQFLHGRHYREILDPKTLDHAQRILLPDDEHWQRAPEWTMFHPDLKTYLPFVIANPDRKYMFDAPH